MEAPTPSIVVTNQPPDLDELTESVTAQFIVKNFEELDSEFENDFSQAPSVDSPKFYAHGIPFSMSLKPGGCKKGSKDVALFLRNPSDETRWVSFRFRLVNQVDATNSHYVAGGPYAWAPKLLKKEEGRGS